MAAVERMTPEQYVANKRAAATAVGHPIPRLCAPTLETLEDARISRMYANNDPQQRRPTSTGTLQWFWFDDDGLVTRSTKGDYSTAPSLRSSAPEFVTAFQDGAATIVLAERSEFDRLLAMIGDDSIVSVMRLFASLPVSRHITILTEALTLCYWAQSGLDTSKISDWEQAFGMSESTERPTRLLTLSRMCTGEDDARTYQRCYPRLTVLEEQMVAAAFDHDEMSFLCAEQVCREWSTIERFDQINVSYGMATGAMADLGPGSVAGAVEGGCIADADVDVSLEVGGYGYYEILVVVPGLIHRVAVTIAGFKSVELHDGRRGSLVHIVPKQRQPPGLVGIPLILAHDDQRSLAGGGVSVMTMTDRWGEGGTSVVRPVGLVQTHVPIDVVIAGST